MRVYLASCYSDRARMCTIRDQILAPMGVEVTARWINGGHEIGADNSANRVIAQDDFDDLTHADLMIFFADVESKRGRGGRHVEFGLALGRRIPIIVVGPRLNVFHWLKGVEHVRDVEALQASIARRLSLRETVDEYRAWLVKHNDLIVVFGREEAEQILAFVEAQLTEDRANAQS
jgi:hypothetical protein